MADLINRIQSLINQANGSGVTEHERIAFLAKAEQMMAAHKIDEAALRARSMARGIADAARHEITDLKMDFVPETDEFRMIHRDNIGYIARLVGTRIVFLGYTGKVHVIGTQTDIDYMRLLWTSTLLTFSDKLYPKWNRGASARKNIRNMVEAGYKWLWIWEHAVSEGQPFMRKRKGSTEMEPVPAPPNDGGWMKRELKKAYDETGEEKPQLTHGVRNYRNSYALGFGQEFQDRIARMIVDREHRERDTNGAALVLASDRDALEDYFNKLYPPETLGYGVRERLVGNHAGAAAAGRAAARNADLSGGSGGVSGRSARALG